MCFEALMEMRDVVCSIDGLELLPRISGHLIADALPLLEGISLFV